MANTKLPAVGTLVARVEAPTVLYRVTSTIRDSGKPVAVRLLPYQRQGREVLAILDGRRIVGDGSVWEKMP